MSRTNFKELLDAGVHFGHLKRKWNPIPLHKDVGSHVGVPFPLQMPEVYSGIEQLFKICS